MDAKIEMSLKIGRYEWAVEQTELAYERKQIGKIAFTRRMKKLGFSVEYCREWLKEQDAR